MDREMWRWSVRTTCFRGHSMGDTQTIEEVQVAELFSRLRLVGQEFPNYWLLL